MSEETIFRQIRCPVCRHPLVEIDVKQSTGLARSVCKRCSAASVIKFRAGKSPMIVDTTHKVFTNQQNV